MTHRHPYSALTTAAQVAAAVSKVVTTVKILQMSSDDMDDLIAVDVSSALAGPDVNALTHYAAGLVHAWRMSIIEDHCEFIYTDTNGDRYDSEVDTDLPHFSSMHATLMDSATARFVWKGTDSPFTVPVTVGELS